MALVARVWLIRLALTCCAVRVRYRRPYIPDAEEQPRLQLFVEDGDDFGDGRNSESLFGSQICDGSDDDGGAATPRGGLAPPDMVEGVRGGLGPPDMLEGVGTPVVAPATPLDPPGTTIVAASAGTSQGASDMQLVLHVHRSQGAQNWGPPLLYPRHGLPAQPESLRAAAKQILKAENVDADSPANSGSYALIASCRCGRKGCTYQWRFSFQDWTTVRAAIRGKHPEEGELSRIAKKRKTLELARGNKDATPGRALVLLEKKGIPDEEWPSDRQLETQRRPKERPPVYPTETIGMLTEFLERCRGSDAIHVFEDSVVIAPNDIRVPFSPTQAWQRAADFADFSCFLMDYTFSTNKHNLVLGCIGPCGLRIDKRTRLPCVQLMPVIFCVCKSEDKRAHTLLLELYELWRAQAGAAQEGGGSGPAVEACKGGGSDPAVGARKGAAAVPLSDGFLDHACLASAAEYFGEGREVYLHRCLEHVKTDLTKEARAKDPASGKPRLRLPEHLQVIKEWVMDTAFWGSDVEFDAFWREADTRLSSSALDTDFDEPGMAAYIRRNVLDTDSGPLIRAAWASGVFAVPHGYTTYATNSMERAHRTLKGLMDTGYAGQSLGNLIEETCDVINSRYKAKFFAQVRPRLREAPQPLRKGTQKLARNLHVELDDPGESTRELDLDDLLRHYRAYGAKKTFLSAHCTRVLASGQTARLVYILPRRTLRWALERPGEMETMKALALSKRASDVRSACASSQGTYDIVWHIKLRRRYTVVYWTDDSEAVDDGKDFIVQGGFSAHALFVRGSSTKGYFAKLPDGTTKGKKGAARTRKLNTQLPCSGDCYPPS